MEEDQVGTPLGEPPPAWFLVGCLAFALAAAAGLGLLVLRAC